MARRYSDTERAAIWALRCQGMPPIEIRRTLEADGAGLGYQLAVPKRSMRDILQRLELEHGPPQAQIVRGQEADAIELIRLEALGAIRARVNELTNKQRTGGDLSSADMKALDAALQAVDGYERRRRADSPRDSQTRKARDSKTSAAPALLEQLRQRMPTD